MPRKPRVHYSGAIYHVIIRGNNKEFIFQESLNKKLYLEEVRKYIDKYKASFYAYVIIHIHAHVLIGVSEVSEQSISKIVNRI